MDRRVRKGLLPPGAALQHRADRRRHHARAARDLDHGDRRGAGEARAAARCRARGRRRLALGRYRRSRPGARAPRGPREAERHRAQGVPSPSARPGAAREAGTRPARSRAQRDRCLRRIARRPRAHRPGVGCRRRAALGGHPACPRDPRMPERGTREEMRARWRRRLRAGVHGAAVRARPHHGARSGADRLDRPGQARSPRAGRRRPRRPVPARGLRSLRMTRPPSVRFAFGHPAHVIALGFGTGLAPLGPGTAGTMLAFPVYMLLDRWLDAPELFGAIVLFFAIGVWACGRTGRDLGVADHGAINWHEVVSMMLILLVVPAGLEWWVFAFGVFRFFDVVKPPPIRHIDRTMKSGFGVMFDDVVAAFYTLLLVALVKRVFF